MTSLLRDTVWPLRTWQSETVRDERGNPRCTSKCPVSECANSPSYDDGEERTKKKKSSRTRIDAQKRGLGNHYNLARPYHRANETEEKNLAGGNGCWGPVGTLNFR